MYTSLVKLRLPKSTPEDTKSYILKIHLQNKENKCFALPLRNVASGSLSKRMKERGRGEGSDREDD